MGATYHRYFGVRPSPICRSLLQTACWNARRKFFREAHARALLVARHSWQILSSPTVAGSSVTSRLSTRIALLVSREQAEPLVQQTVTLAKPAT